MAQKNLAPFFITSYDKKIAKKKRKFLSFHHFFLRGMALFANLALFLSQVDIRKFEKMIIFLCFFTKV